MAKKRPTLKLLDELLKSEFVDENFSETHQKIAMLYALAKHQGRVTHALMDCCTTFEEHNRWIKLDKKYRLAVDFIDEGYKDDIEKLSYNAMTRGNAQTITFALKTKLRGRGYGSEESIGTLPDVIDIGFDDEDDDET